MNIRIRLTGTGTSQGVPVIGCDCEVCLSGDPRDTRLRTACLIRSETTTIAIDTGPDFRQQMLLAGTQQLNAVLFTHPHKDHTAGLDDTRPFFFRQRKPIDIYASPMVQEQLKREYSYAFETQNKYPGAPDFQLFTMSELPFHVGDISVRAIPMMHGKMPVYGFRIGAFAYLTDVNFIPEASFELLHGLEVLVLDALRHDVHHSHFNLRQAVEVAERIGARKTWFTHISHLMGRAAEIDPDLPESIALGYDGLEFEIEY
jgi:phosphoribosyl 1,2-cyclic phosphate phosphodiesterase